MMFALLFFLLICSLTGFCEYILHYPTDLTTFLLPCLHPTHLYSPATGFHPSLLLVIFFLLCVPLISSRTDGLGCRLRETLTLHSSTFPHPCCHLRIFFSISTTLPSLTQFLWFSSYSCCPLFLSGEDKCHKLGKHKAPKKKEKTNLTHFSFLRWLDEGEDDGKIVREIYARDKTIFSVSECHKCTFLEKSCFMMNKASTIHLKLINFPIIFPGKKLERKRKETVRFCFKSFITNSFRQPFDVLSKRSRPFFSEDCYLVVSFPHVFSDGLYFVYILVGC